MELPYSRPPIKNSLQIPWQPSRVDAPFFRELSCSAAEAAFVPLTGHNMPPSPTIREMLPTRFLTYVLVFPEFAVWSRTRMHSSRAPYPTRSAHVPVTMS